MAIPEQRILNIIKEKGVFEVSWQYRDYVMRRRLKLMVRKKLVKEVKGKSGMYQFVLADKDETKCPK